MCKGDLRKVGGIARGDTTSAPPRTSLATRRGTPASQVCKKWLGLRRWKRLGGRKVSFPDFPTMLTWNVYEAIKINRKAKYSWLADNLGVSEATIKRAIADLKELGYINPEHSKVNGEWQLLM